MLSRLLALALLAIPPATNAQTLVYSGREYKQAGQSWAQIWEADPRTGRHRQLTTTSRGHWKPWCSPDGRSVFFATNALGEQSFLYRFDRRTTRESVVLPLARPLRRVVGVIDQSQAILEEDDRFEIVDINKGRTLRSVVGVNLVLSPNLKFVAWQTALELQNHIKISEISGTNVLDLGEGSAPAFTPDSQVLMFVRFERASGRLQLVRYSIGSGLKETATAQVPDMWDPYALTISPDGTSIVLASCCGRHGSAVYWRMGHAQGWERLDDNLNQWGGWSPDGMLAYATDGQDLRLLDSRRHVWVGDLKLYDSRTGQVRTLITGISLNDEPRWCGTCSRR